MTMTATESLLIVIDSDRTYYDVCMTVALANIDARHAEEDAGTWSHEEAEKFHTADDIKDHVETLMDDISLKPCRTIAGAYRESADLIARQLISSALEEINWHEVAEHYIRKIKEQTARA
jgi:hypothetical protein